MDVPIFEAFGRYLLDDRRFSPRTLRCYLTDLHHIAKILRRQYGIEHCAEREAAAWEAVRFRREVNASPPTLTHLLCTIEVKDIRSALASLAAEKLAPCGDKEERNYGPATIARKVAALRSFFRWMHRNRYRSNNPGEGLRRPTVSPAPIVALSSEQIDALFGSAGESFRGLRACAMLELTCAGLTTGELERANWSHYNAENGTITVERKGKECTITLHAGALEALDAYMSALSARLGENAVSADEPQPMFVNKHGTRLSSRSWRRQFTVMVRDAGLPAATTPRLVRQSAASHLLVQGTDIGALQERLGHSAPTTTLSLLDRITATA